MHTRQAASRTSEPDRPSAQQLMKEKREQSLGFRHFAECDAYNLERAALPRLCGTAIAEVAGRRGRSSNLFRKFVVGFSNRRYVPAAMTRPVASMAAKYAHA